MKFRKKNKYSSECVWGNEETKKKIKVNIRSEVKLDEEQVDRITNIVKETISQSYYDPCFHISRNAYHLIDNVTSVRTWFIKKSDNVIIEIAGQ